MTHRKDMRLTKSARGNTSSRQKRVNRPPQGEPFVWFSRAMMESDAYRSLSGNALQALARICIEHMAHAGTENGNLVATHEQIAAHGVRKPSVAQAIRELEFFGFVRAEKGYAYRGNHVPSRYRLTWLPLPDGAPATNEWKGITAAHKQAWRAQVAEQNKVQKSARQAKHQKQAFQQAENVVELRKVGGRNRG